VHRSQVDSSQVHPSQVDRAQHIQQWIVTAAQMRQIEARVFEAGMPVAALMEKVAGLIFTWMRSHYPLDQFPNIGILVGAGHNGGDALVVARELALAGYQVRLLQPLQPQKELTAAHGRYAASLNIPTVETVAELETCDVILDGLFGFGLTRSLTDPILSIVEQVNALEKPIVSIDLPSGVETDSGVVLGAAIAATHTLCLGLWKRAFFQESALEAIGQAELIDFGLPLADVMVILDPPLLYRFTPKQAIARLPKRSITTHKYREGHVLLVCGSRRYSGAAILAGLAARASGVGMLSMAVPASLKPLIVGQIPDALVIDCPEEETGAIASLSYANSKLPAFVDFDKYDAIACGCGLTLQSYPLVEQVLRCHCPLILDADGLNILAALGTIPTLQARLAPTILTPHWGEFVRLFPEYKIIEKNTEGDRLNAVKAAAEQSGAIVLLKGARTAIALPNGAVAVISESTPALARGGSGDVLTGLMAGLMAQVMCHVQTKLERQSEGSGVDPQQVVQILGSVVETAAGWHVQAGLQAAEERTELGVDASTLVEFLSRALQNNMVSVSR
jgi:ADP-dependent NAD(P)H-hydrate dehydratase / NAD(P)H-hydrate epimerase